MQLTINKHEVTPNQDTYINTILRGRKCTVDYCGLSMNGILVKYVSSVYNIHGFRIVGQKKISLGYDNMTVKVTDSELKEYQSLN